MNALPAIDPTRRNPPRQRVLLVNRQPALRRQLAALFSQALPQAEVQVADGIAAARRLVSAQPVDALLVDTRLGDDSDALELAPWLRRVSPATRLVFVSLATAAAVDAALERLGGRRPEDQPALDPQKLGDAERGHGWGGLQMPALNIGFAPAD